IWLAELFHNCFQTKNIKLGRGLHSLLIKTSLLLDTFLANRLMEMYSRCCDSIVSVQKAFDEIEFRNCHSWNILMNSYCQVGRLCTARKLFDEIPVPSLYTAVGLANACGGLGFLKLLRQVHGFAIVSGFKFNNVVRNALVDAYGKCGEYETSRWIFRTIIDKDIVSNVVSWTSLISGFVKNGEGETALSIFRRMVVEEEDDVSPNEVTYVSCLSACADLPSISTGKQIHCRFIRTSDTSVSDNVSISNALIDVYSKSGDMIYPMNLFRSLRTKNTVTWNSMIVGFARNGSVSESLSTFGNMSKAGFRPDEVTLVGILTGCSHSGLESEGLKFLDSMEDEFDLIPRYDHYGILVDLLGRKDRFSEALRVIERARCGPNHEGMWGAVLSSSCVHGDLKTATRAAEVLFGLDPENVGRYVTLSNVYRGSGRWDESARIRERLKEMDVEKEVGCS
ncbi:hypothetical protein M569_05443, partial [Genlisea aurea]